MSKEAIKRFNYIVGNPPVGIDGEANDIWRQLQLSSKLILEEAKELHDAANSCDILEVLDGSEDVYYLRTYMDELLKALNIDVLGARYEVAKNNEGKYTTSPELALQSMQYHTENENDCYVEEVDYNNTRYYIVKRSSDGKVQKLTTHVPPNLDQFIPQSLKEKLNG